jgi:hypothetical protein
VPRRNEAEPRKLEGVKERTGVCIRDAEAQTGLHTG